MVSAKLICNPTAGRGRAGRLLGDVQTMLHSLGVTNTVALTHRPGEATTLAAQALDEGYTRVIAMGGDGTVHGVYLF